MMVIYPRPADVDGFERAYANEHVPMAVDKLAGKTMLVATKLLGAHSGTLPFYQIAEVHFPSMDALNARAASPGGQETLAQAVAISSGGPPVVLVAEEETYRS
jgi:uncharacterized protein (TIGR02118 family)